MVSAFGCKEKSPKQENCTFYLVVVLLNLRVFSKIRKSVPLLFLLFLDPFYHLLSTFDLDFQALNNTLGFMQPFDSLTCCCCWCYFYCQVSNLQNIPILKNLHKMSAFENTTYFVWWCRFILLIDLLFKASMKNRF